MYIYNICTCIYNIRRKRRRNIRHTCIHNIRRKKVRGGGGMKENREGKVEKKGREGKTRGGRKERRKEERTKKKRSMKKQGQKE